MSRIFGDVRQNGYVVRDIEAAMKHWTEVVGVGPFFYLEKPPIEDFRYYGEPSDALVSIALSNSGPLQIELIQQCKDEPSMYNDFLAAGHEGLQHTAYWTSELKNSATSSDSRARWAARPVVSCTSHEIGMARTRSVESKTESRGIQMTVKMPMPQDEDLPESTRTALAEAPPLNIFRMLANAPTSFQPLIDLATSVLLTSEFDARKREIAILRIAHVTGSIYEWTQHERLAKNLGVSEAEIEAISVDGPVKELSEEGNLLCRVAEEISCDVRLSDEALSAIIERYGQRQATELILCCSYFNMISRFLESTRVELEDENLIGTKTPDEVARGTN